MRFIRKYSVLLLIIGGAWNKPAQAQSVSEIIRFADTQYVSGNFHSASKEYQRALFFNTNSQNDGYLYRQLGNVHFAMQKYEQAMRFFDNAYYFSIDDSIQNEILLQKAGCYIYDEKFRFALIELYSVNDTISDYFYRKQQFYIGICYFGLENFRLAETSFINSVDTAYQEQRQAIRRIFEKKRNYKHPNPKVAFALSLVIPGAGQIYAGDIKNGINSFVLTGGLLYAGIYMTKNYSFLDAFFAIYPWFQRYYQGGFTHARQIATKQRAKNRHETYKKILRIISSIK